MERLVVNSTKKIVKVIVTQKIKTLQIIDTRINKISLNIIVINYSGLENKA